MNLTQKLLIAAGCCIVAFSTCKKDNPSPDNYISYKLNGTYKTVKPDADFFDDGSFLLTAGPDGKDEISLFIDSSVAIQEKTYDLGNSFDGAICNYVDHSGKYFWSDSGRLVIRSLSDDHMSGSFSFKGKAEDGSQAVISITEGQFSSHVSFISFSPDTCTLCDSTYGVKTHLKVMQRFLGRKQLAVATAAKNK